MAVNAQHDEPRFKRCSDVCGQIGVKKSTLYRWVADKKFPAPIRIGENTSVWLSTAIDKWMAERIASAARAAEKAA